MSTLKILCICCNLRSAERSAGIAAEFMNWIFHGLEAFKWLLTLGKLEFPDLHAS